MECRVLGTLTRQAETVTGTVPHSASKKGWPKILVVPIDKWAGAEHRSARSPVYPRVLDLV